jgi:hypothetical protein
MWFYVLTAVVMNSAGWDIMPLGPTLADFLFRPLFDPDDGGDMCL